VGGLADYLMRYWITFDVADDVASLVRPGVGVTAVSRDDALELVRATLFAGGSLPPVAAVIEDVDVRTLDEGHVRPNMGDPSARGVWFPRVA
jgi:hypothetical protein